MRPLLIPEYYSEFKCIGGDCEDTCCAGWTVPIDKKTYQNYRQVRHPEMREKLNTNVKRNRQEPDDNFYAKIAMDAEGKCTMLLNDGFCGIQKELGEEYLCNTCAIYPRNLMKVGNVVEKSLTLSCPEAARIVLLREEGIGFIETEEPKNTRGYMNQQLDLEQNPLFWDLRVFTIQLLQHRQQPLEIRLIILGLFLQKIEQIKPSELEIHLADIMQDYLARLDNEEFIASLKNIEGNLSFQVILARELIHYRLTSHHASEKYLNLLQQLVDGLGLEENIEKELEDSTKKTIKKYRESYTSYYEPFMTKNEYMFENYIVNYVFKNLFPNDYDTFFESYIMLVIHYSLIKLHLVGMAAKRQKLTQEMMVECVQQFAKVVEHNVSYLKDVQEGIKESGVNTMGHMFVMIKS